MEKRADNLFAKLESIRGILDRIAQSQTDKMVRDRRLSPLCGFVVSPLQLSELSAGHAGLPGRSVGSEAVSEGHERGASREPRGSDPGGKIKDTLRFDHQGSLSLTLMSDLNSSSCATPRTR